MDCEYPLDICSFFLWCLVVLYLLGAGDFLFCWRYRGTLEKDGIGLCGDGERDARGRWHRSGSGCRSWMLLRFCGWMERGTPEEVASVRAGTPSGDTTRAP